MQSDIFLYVYLLEVYSSKFNAKKMAPILGMPRQHFMLTGDAASPVWCNFHTQTIKRSFTVKESVEIVTLSKKEEKHHWP